MELCRGAVNAAIRLKMTDSPSPTAASDHDPNTVLLLQLLDHCVAEKASDLHLSADHPPYLRLQGLLAPLADQATLSPTTLRGMANYLCQGCNVQALEETGALDGALSTADGTRFRYNVYRRGGEFSIALRRLEETIRQLSDLGLSDDLYQLAELRDGLVLLAGPTGCGKSTTLATLIDRINRSRRSHIITIEDPIEYLHPSHHSLVDQRQIGTDARSFNDALVAALRQDPDVILVGEIRDLETIRTAITAAETGHLVFATVHASDCAGSIDRLVTVFPAEEQPGIRRQLAMVLRAIIAQRLLVSDGMKFDSSSAPQQNDSTRPLVLASEVLMVNSAVGNLIAQAKDAQIYSMMETGSSEGMYTFEENLARLLQRRLISERTAVAIAKNPQVMLNRLRQGAASNGNRLSTRNR